MGLDPSGARLVTGGYDYDVKFWDFAGMDASLRHFRQIRPCERLELLTDNISFTIPEFVYYAEKYYLKCYTYID